MIKNIVRKKISYPSIYPNLQEELSSKNGHKYVIAIHKHGVRDSRTKIVYHPMYRIYTAQLGRGGDWSAWVGKALSGRTVRVKLSNLHILDGVTYYGTVEERQLYSDLLKNKGVLTVEDYQELNAKLREMEAYHFDSVFSEAS